MRILLLAFFLALPAQATTYRWVDERGVVHYSDSMPTQVPRKGTAEISKQGSVVKRYPGWMTPEERKAFEAAQVQQRQEAQEAEDRSRRDRALLSTFTSEKEIDLLRDRSIDQQLAAIRTVEIQMKPVKARLTELQGQMAAVKKFGATMPPRLENELKVAETEVAQLDATLRRRHQVIDEIRAKADADKQRFRELNATNAAPPPVTPTVSSEKVR